MTVRRHWLLGLLLVAASCADPVIEYDPLRDQARVAADLGHVDLPDHVGLDVTLKATLRGPGRHPAHWDAMLGVTVEGPWDCIADLGGRFEVSVGGRTRVEPIVLPADSLHVRVRRDIVLAVDREDLIALVEGGRLVVNGTPHVLDREGRDELRRALLIASYKTNEARWW
jgi:hypothetical protein